jgi:hypothetical protein
MDTMGDADELGHDDIGDERRVGLLTPETCAISSAGLVLFSIFSGAPLQLLQLGVYDNGGLDATDPAFLWLVAPAALLALGGMLLAARARRGALSAGLHGLSGAATMIGGVLIAIYLLGYLRLLVD